MSHPLAILDAVEANALRFAQTARQLGRAARRRGLYAPGFRSPPRVAGANRSIRRQPAGATVSVRFRGRPWPAVVADMIEGVVVANRLTGSEADEARTALWRAIEHELMPAPSPAPRRQSVPVLRPVDEGRSAAA